MRARSLTTSSVASPSTSLDVRIWCRVVDNYGDAGVCWRLARQLAREHNAAVTLHVDRIPTLAAIEPRVRGGVAVDGVTIVAWHDDPAESSREALSPGSVIVSAFGCELPQPTRAAIVNAGQRVLWVNLEYLSAEPWVEGCHRLRSVKPGDGAVEHFFYPGYTTHTGGLLRERDLLARRDAFVASNAARDWLTRHGVEYRDDELRVSVFCYPDAPLAQFADILAQTKRPVRLLLTAGVGNALPVTPRGALCVSQLPWLAQDDYDRLLWSCDVNFVRGEDSWVRAQWAGAPFVWQPYRQEGDTHFVKLDAFLERLTRNASRHVSDRVSALMRAWSGAGDLATAWSAYVDALDDVRALHADWSAALARQPDLAASLVEYCRSQL